ncbi:hypothetical protein C486_06448 [Natrinema gari JCM 14663]|uniref:Uncharacterized protein n=1 Tax=Natrinema gari JCM 14663 TaxID=1230459 RepID=L9Z7K4_9EURY|nr:hypothetical protein C486_06448 [Natrinema gari JCM 14663]
MHHRDRRQHFIDMPADFDTEYADIGPNLN